MIQSKGWDWKDVNGDFKKYWLTPSVESFYLLHRWKDNGYTSFLDLGCGLGRHSVLFSKNGFHVHAFDISEDAISRTQIWAKSENLDVDCKIGDMLNLPYSNNQFDCIFCKNVISHTDTAGVKKGIKEMYRVLKKEGECYLTLSSKDTSDYKQTDWPMVDENTLLKMEEGPEFKVPHFYADHNLISSLFSDFRIETIYQVIEYYEKDEKVFNSFHYHILAKKPL